MKDSHLKKKKANDDWEGKIIWRRREGRGLNCRLFPDRFEQKCSMHKWTAEIGGEIWSSLIWGSFFGVHQASTWWYKVLDNMADAIHLQSDDYHQSLFENFFWIGIFFMNQMDWLVIYVKY